MNLTLFRETIHRAIKTGKKVLINTTEFTPSLPQIGTDVLNPEFSAEQLNQFDPPKYVRVYTDDLDSAQYRVKAKFKKSLYGHPLNAEYSIHLHFFEHHMELRNNSIAMVVLARVKYNEISIVSESDSVIELRAEHMEVGTNKTTTISFDAMLERAKLTNNTQVSTANA